MEEYHLEFLVFWGTVVDTLKPGPGSDCVPLYGAQGLHVVTHILQT